jgi:hypothetical protein
MMAGLHEHSCDAMALDVDLSRTAAVAEALSLADVFSGGRGRGPGGAGAAYAPACLMAAAAAARRGSAGGGAQLAGALRWPRAQAECARRLAATQAMLRAWTGRARPAAARGLASGPRGALAVAHALKRAARPGPGAVRGVVPSMMAPQERALLAHQVGLSLGPGGGAQATGHKGPEAGLLRKGPRAGRHYLLRRAAPPAQPFPTARPASPPIPPRWTCWQSTA